MRVRARQAPRFPACLHLPNGLFQILEQNGKQHSGLTGLAMKSLIPAASAPCLRQRHWPSWRRWVCTLVVRQMANQASGLQAVQAGHLHVHENQVVASLAGPFDRFDAVVATSTCRSTSSSSRQAIS
jgi:hypothetical protein